MINQNEGWAGMNVSCAGCDQDYVHHTGFIWFQRGEDDAEGMARYVDNGSEGSFTYTDEGSANPSRRRHGCVLLFECEQCDTVTQVSFAQHKGMTEVDAGKAHPGRDPMFANKRERANPGGY